MSDLLLNKQLVERCANVSDDVSKVKFLLDSGADIHYSCDLPLRIAIEYKNHKIVEFLVVYGANVNALRGDALLTAVEGQDLKMISYLVEKVKIIPSFSKAKECICHALNTRRFDIAKYLIEKGFEWRNIEQFEDIKTRAEMIAYFELILI